jgi:SNF2 family DNA or RNA helicase
MKELMETESKEEHKWIVFCHFHEEMVLLKAYLETCTFIRQIETYSGSMNASQKEAALKKVHEPFAGGKTCDVLLVQLKAGGVGLNLQIFDRIIFNSPWWTQAAIDQGIGRAVRIGQQKQVVVHNLVLKQEEVNNVRNIDSWMKKIADKKDITNKTILDFAAH